MVSHRYFGDFCTQPVRIDRDESMHFAIEFHAFDDIAPIGFERAPVVVQAHSGYLRDKPVRYAAWKDPAHGMIVAALAPAGANIEPFVQLSEKERDVLWI